MNSTISQSNKSSTTKTHCSLQGGFRTFASVVIILMILFSLIGNMILFSIVYRRPSMRSGINLLLANLSLSDFANALVNLPFLVALFNLEQWPFGKVFCGINVALCFLMNIEKVCILSAISIDRYFIIVKRKSIMTPSKANVFILLSWIVTLIISVFPAVGWGTFRHRCGYIQCLIDFESRSNLSSSYLIFYSTLTIFIPAFALLFVYSNILKIVRRSCFRVENYPPVAPTAMHMKGRLFINYDYKRRTSATILILCIVLMTCLIPIGLLNIYVSVHGLTPLVTRDIYQFFLWISHIHGTFNPIIYFSRIKRFREYVQELCPQFVLRFISHRSRRRVKPHVLYQVEKGEIKVNFHTEVVF